MADPGAPPAPVLASTDDRYEGVLVTPEELPLDSQAFCASLVQSLQVWREQGKRGVWLKVPVDRAALIALAIEHGEFSFHHAEEGYVMLTRWLHSATSTLPPNASHQVGIGAFVYDRVRGQVLVVQECNGPLKGKGVWKMPTGLVLAGEDISEAAEREVLEETGVRAKFSGMLAVRQAHGFAFGKSDLFFLCALEPEASDEPQQTKPQESEIEAAGWLPFEEFCESYLNMPGQPGPMPELYQKLVERCRAHVEGRCSGLPVARLESGLWGRRRQDLLCWAVDDHVGALPLAGAASNGAGLVHSAL